MAVKKTRTDAWEAKLEDAQRSALYVRGSAMSYQAAKLWALQDLKVKLPSQSAWYRFLARLREEDSALRLAKASSVSKEIGLLSAKGGIADLDLVKSFQSMASEQALAGNSQEANRYVNMACLIANSAARSEEVRIANEKLKLLQEKEAKLVKAVRDDKLTDEDRVNKVKSIFGIK